MFIKELSQRTGVSAKTIRYYESIGLLPPPQRADNNYRVYTLDTVECLRFIVAARALDFSLADIAGFLAARDEHQLHCHQMAISLEQRILALDRRIADLLALRKTLVNIRNKAQHLPLDSECDVQCLPDLLTANCKNEQLTIHKERT